MKLFHSIQSRITFVTGFFLVSAVLLGSGICCLIYNNLLTDTITDTAYSELNDVSHNITSSLDLTQDVGATLSRMVSAEEACGTLSDEKLHLLANTMATRTGVTHCGIFLLKDTMPPADVDKFAWYNDARLQGLGVWNTPKEAGPATADNIIATYACPIYNASAEQMGEAVVQVSHHHIASIIDNASISPHSFHQLVRKDGRILVNTNPNTANVSNISEFLSSEQCADIDDIWNYLDSHNRGLFIGTVNGQKGYFTYTAVPRTQWLVMSFMPTSDLYDTEFMTKLIFMLIGVLALTIASIVFTRTLIRRNLNPLKGLNAASKAVARGDFEHPLPAVADSDELTDLVTTFDKMRHDIVDHIAQEKEAAAQHERIENELRIAQNIQLEMLPPNNEAHPYAQQHDFYALMRTAREVGGDLYHYHYIPDRFLFSIGDVSGKGVPSSIYMSQIITQLRYISITEEKEHTRNMGLINKSVCEENTYHMFSTLMLVSLDLRTGELVTCNAGHDTPIIIDPQGNVSQLITDVNIPIGLTKEFSFAKQTDIVEPGSVIFCYTDGVTEAMNEAGELYGIERLCEVLKNTNHLSPKEIVNRVLNDFDTFVGQAERSDDITMFVVNYKG